MNAASQCQWFQQQLGFGVTDLYKPNKNMLLCVSSLAGCADLNSLDSLSPQEKKRQGYIHELIETEDRYVEDLQIVLEVKGHVTCQCIQ